MLIGLIIRELDATMHYVSLENKYFFINHKKLYLGNITLENISLLSTTYCLRVVTLIQWCDYF